MVKAFINEFAENTYLLIEKQEAIIIDPGASFKEIKSYLEENEITLKLILLTHGHVDHIISVNDLINEYGIDVYINAEERDFMFDPNLNLSSQMFKKIKIEQKANVKTFTEHDTFNIGEETISILHLPGHTRGCSSFKYKNRVYVGDTIFSDGVGRTDLPTGSSVQLEQSINKLLNTYSDNTLLYPGHGKHTTVLTQKNRCPYYHK